MKRAAENNVVTESEIDRTKDYKLGKKQDGPSAEKTHGFRCCSLFGIEVAGNPVFDGQRQLEQDVASGKVQLP